MMKKFNMACLGLLALFSLSGCGPSHQDLQNSKDREKETNKQKFELENKNAALKNVLNNLEVVNGNLWVFVDAFVDYSYAEKRCLEIGFLMPSETDLAEFKSQSPKKYDDLRMKTDGQWMEIHAKDKTISVKNGQAICVKKVSESK